MQAVIFTTLVGKGGLLSLKAHDRYGLDPTQLVNKRKKN